MVNWEMYAIVGRLSTQPYRAPIANCDRAIPAAARTVARETFLSFPRQFQGKCLEMSRARRPVDRENRGGNFMINFTFRVELFL
jgi:hypothetical protein